MSHMNEGNKIKIDVEYVHRYAWEEIYKNGNGQQYIYIFKDVQGNIYQWNTNKFIYAESGNKMLLTGTIKYFVEVKGEKQIALTYCKVNKI